MQQEIDFRDSMIDSLLGRIKNLTQEIAVLQASLDMQNKQNVLLAQELTKQQRKEGEDE